MIKPNNSVQISSTDVSSHHKSHQKLMGELSKAKQIVKVGAIYAHYKYPKNTYKVIALAFREANDSLCVVYQAIYNEELIFIRELESWLETPELNGVTVPRFNLVR